MEIKIGNETISGETTIATIIHGGEQITCNIALFDRSSYSGRYDLFEHNNLYWSKLPEAEQTHIFGIYKKIKTVYDTIWTVSDLDDALYPLVNELLMAHDLEKINFWISFHSDILIPQDIDETFVESNENTNTRVKTYLQKDYRELVVMTMVLRTMIPVWGEYIASTKNEYGTEFKEYYAFKLMSTSLLDQCHPMIKLRDYIYHNIPSEKERSKATAILGGIGSEDLPEWLLGLVVVRKLCAGDIRGVEQSGHLVTAIWSYLKNKLKTLESSFTGNIRAKVPEDRNNDSDNKASLLEGYRGKQDVNPGDIKAIKTFIQEPKNKGVSQLAKFVCPDIPNELIKISIQSTKVIIGKPINAAQKMLVQWVLSDVIPCRSLGFNGMEHMCTIKEIATTQALLWHRGHYMLAAFVSAIEYVQDDKMVSMYGSDSRARIPKDHIEQLDILYPFSQKPSGKRKVFKKVNPAVENIDLVASLLGERDWIVTLPDHMLAQIPGIGDRRKIGVPHDIRILLSTLAISIAKGQF